ncbi:unnamed protein product [Miscanthus lutarioriparius]|uniref:Uncharacterized protein n=1 Tax=Miscanthus lutarioriparius TaxID=422564 RepID=A0A811PMB5_9POAL|nr:unnamed protein product [Miscanthus lutarioriparius]
MDIVHAGHDLGGGGWMGPGVMLEFALFAVYRVLRSRGLVLAGPLRLRRRVAEHDVRADD